MKAWLDDKELREGLKQGLLLGAALLVLTLPPRPHEQRRPAALPLQQQQQQVPPAIMPLLPSAMPHRQLELGGSRASPALRRLAQWVLDTADNGAKPFAVLDKRNARVLVFEPDGRLAGATAVLLGYAAGDDSVAGIGNRPVAEVRPQERTTPAGRFQAAPGRNALGEEVLWVDYEAAVSMHRVRLNNPQERRQQRLDSPSASDNRISYGCINMPAVFFEQVLWPRFGRSGGLVYVLPEIKPLGAVFPGLAAST